MGIDDDEGETDEGEQLIPGRYEEKILAEGPLEPNGKCCLLQRSGIKRFRACQNQATRTVLHAGKLLNICEEHFQMKSPPPVPATRGRMIDAWLTGKPPTVRFVIAELGDDGLVHVRASSDERYDDGPSASGRNYIEALDALEKKLAEKLLD